MTNPSSNPNYDLAAVYNNLSPQNKRDFQKVSKKVGDPEVEKRLSQWQTEELGRSGYAHIRMEGGEPLWLHVAQSFPLILDQTKSVVVFRDGNAILTKVKDKSNKKKYQSVWGMKQAIIRFAGHYNSVEEIIDAFSYKDFGDAEIELDSRKPEHAARLKEAMRKGPQMAQRIKEEAEQGRKTNKENIMELFPDPDESDEEEKDIS